jgi:ABC-type lipoprotein export system ATPase subunit
LDELTASVDEHNAEVLVELLLGQRDKTVIAVTHDVAFIEKATEHVVIRNGRAVASDGSGDGGRNGRR